MRELEEFYNKMNARSYTVDELQMPKLLDNEGSFIHNKNYLDLAFSKKRKSKHSLHKVEELKEEHDEIL